MSFRVINFKLQLPNNVLGDGTHCACHQIIQQHFLTRAACFIEGLRHSLRAKASLRVDSCIKRIEWPRKVWYHFPTAHWWSAKVIPNNSLVTMRANFVRHVALDLQCKQEAGNSKVTFPRTCHCEKRSCLLLTACCCSWNSDRTRQKGNLLGCDHFVKMI